VVSGCDEAQPAAVAYVTGHWMLIGADLLKLGRSQGLGAPIVSISGAGTFDGIFTNGSRRRAFSRVSAKN
jgi:uncharacterized membrane protein